MQHSLRKAFLPLSLLLAAAACSNATQASPEEAYRHTMQLSSCKQLLREAAYIKTLEAELQALAKHTSSGHFTLATFGEHLPHRKDIEKRLGDLQSKKRTLESLHGEKGCSHA